MSGPWSGVRRLLAVRLDSLGDVLMTTPALRAFKETLGCSITLLTSPAGAAVAPHVPEIDDVIVFSAPWMKAEGHQPGADLAMIDTLRARGFDAAAIFTVYSQNPLPAAYLCTLAGIPRRLAHCRENPYSLLTDWQKELEPDAVVRHEVERQLALAAAVGCVPADQGLSFRVPESARRRIRALRLRAPLVVVHPGASAPSRRYPPESFARAIAEFAASTGCSVVLTGDLHEKDLVDGILEQLAVHAQRPVHAQSLAGKLSLAELGALIEQADLLVSNNTGPAHLAAALGTPVVDLYALTNPQHTPWRVQSRVLFHMVPCRNCYKSVCPHGHNDCLRKVEPRQVAAAARELLHLPRALLRTA